MELRMTNEEALELYRKMLEVYGQHLPHPIHEPIRFAYYVRIFKRYHKDESNTKENV